MVPTPALPTRTSSLLEALTGQRDQGVQVLTPGHVGADLHRRATRLLDPGHQLRQTLGPARAEDESRTAPGEQQRGRLADTAAGSRDRHHLALDSGHEAVPSFPLSAPGFEARGPRLMDERRRRYPQGQPTGADTTVQGRPHRVTACAARAHQRVSGSLNLVSRARLFWN